MNNVLGSTTQKVLSVFFAASIAFVMSSAALAQQDTRTPEEKAYQYRDGVFHAMEWKMGQMIQAKIQADKQAFQKHAGDMAYLAGLIDEGFIANSIVEGSKAKPEIWQDREDFSRRANELQQTAAAFAESGDIEEFNPRKFGGDTCGACHRNYKEKDKE